ncbi:tetratricopeptide repeat protein [Dactylosporangium aurantiacum]|uniref:tetratricopeptide repeat protein n=1 Tax=Dactylosporangium aurantiacum TaxID=35754 RepID=UPI0009DF146F|nr:tetratricopeptide repeat protein [Dactylosporangium aurantiacum]MDG6109994.1 tetratricopeptide repeat protein [Dactylosporangium aurantiacum]
MIGREAATAAAGRIRPAAAAQLLGRCRALSRGGDYARAAATAREAVNALERARGPAATVMMAVLLNELGMYCKYLGRFDEAQRAYERSLGLLEQLPGRDADVASGLHNLAGLAHIRGHLDLAVRLARRGIAVRTAGAPLDRLRLAADEAALAAILVDRGELPQAERLLGDCLATFLQAHGPVHHDVAVTLHNLGSLRHRMGAHAAAARTLRRSLTVKRACLGRRHPDLAVTLYNLARCAAVLGRVQPAVRHLREAVAVLRPVVAESQPTLVACRAELRRLTGVNGRARSPRPAPRVRAARPAAPVRSPRRRWHRPADARTRTCRWRRARRRRRSP